MICANDQKRKYSINTVSCHFAFVDNIRHPFNQTFIAFNIHTFWKMIFDLRLTCTNAREANSAQKLKDFKPPTLVRKLNKVKNIA